MLIYLFYCDDEKFVICMFFFGMVILNDVMKVLCVWEMFFNLGKFVFCVVSVVVMCVVCIFEEFWVDLCEEEVELFCLVFKFKN